MHRIVFRTSVWGIKMKINNHFSKIVSFAIILISISVAKASLWEFVGPDTISYTAMYNWGDGHLLVGGQPNELGKRALFYDSKNHGETWDTLCYGPGFHDIVNLNLVNNRLYASINGNDYARKDDATRFSTLYFSEDSGATWTVVPNFPGSASYWSVGKDSTILVGNSYHVSKSTDNGKNWREIEVEDSQKGVIVCYSVAMYNDTIYAGCNMGLWVSKDWGETWENRKATSSIIFSLFFIKDILVMGNQAAVEYHRHYGDETISDWQLGLLKGPSRVIVCNIADSIVYASVLFYNNTNTKTYLYSSKDSAKTFTQFWITPDTINPVFVNKFFSDGKYAFALTKKGIYRKLIYDDSTIKHASNSILFNKVPNFHIINNAIYLNLKKQSHINLSLYSLNGRLIQEIYSGIKSTGEYQFEFRKPLICNNVYCLQVNVNGNQYSKLINNIK